MFALRSVELMRWLERNDRWSAEIGQCVFALGEAIASEEKSLQSGYLFDTRYASDHIRLISTALKWYLGWLELAREAIVLWVLFAGKQRHVINPDIRRKVSKMIWEQRKEWCSRNPQEFARRK